MKKQFIFLCILCLFISCDKELIYKTRYVSLEPFEKIELKDNFEVFITEGSAYSIEITGEAETVDWVDYKVENNILSIENNKKAKWITPKKNKIEISITSPPLKEIAASEGCNIQTLNPITSIEFGLILKGKSNQATLELNSNTFYYWNYFPSGGKLTLSGKTERLKIWNFAIMSVDAKDLTSQYAVIENSSKGDCEVTVLKKLEYSILGEGNIHLYGEPLEIIADDLSSSGRLIQH